MKCKLAVALIVLICFSGCSGGEASDVVTIRFWHSFVSNTRPALEKLIQRFEEEHPAEAIEKALIGGADPHTALNESAAKSNALLR